MPRTFHPDAGDLHGITCVVDTTGPRILVGRVDTADANGIVLLGADVHEEREGGPTKEEFVRKAAKVGLWPRFDRVHVPSSEIASVRRLSEVAVK